MSGPGRRARLAVPVVLAVLAGGLGWVVVALLPGDASLRGVDYWLLHRPGKVYFARALAEGRLPLWNPHAGLGRPFQADIETATFYPPNLLYAAMDPDAALLLLTWLHACLSAVGMYRLARELGARPGGGAVAATTWATSSLAAGRLFAGQIGYAQALAWLPWVLWLAARVQVRPERRGVAALAVASCLQLLCGHPQAWWVSLVGAGLLLVGRSLVPPWNGVPRRVATSLGRLAAGVALGLGLAAVQLLPTLELIGQSNRAESSLAFAGFGAFSPGAFAALLLPEGLSGAGHWESNLYAGIAAALVGIVGLWRLRDASGRGIAAMALVGGLIAVGEHTPVFALLYQVLPGVSLFRFPQRAAVLVVVALTLACARALRHDPDGTSWRAVAILGGGVAVWALFSPGGGTRLPSATSAIQAALTLSITGLVVQHLRSGLTRAAWAGLLLILALDGLHSTQQARFGYAFTSQRRDLLAEQEDRLVAGMRAQGLFPDSGSPPRVSLPHVLMRENGGLVHGHSTWAAYGSLGLERVWTTLHGTLGLEVPRLSNTYASDEILRRGPFPYPTMNLVLGWDPDTQRAVARRDPDPRAFVVEAALSVSGPAEAVSRLARGHDAHSVALVEEADWVPTRLFRGDANRMAAPETEAEIVSFAPEEIRIRVKSASEGILVVGETWYPGWRAWVDGVEAPCRPVNAWMRGVPIGDGTTEVVLRYRSRFLGAGALLTLASLVGVGFLVRRPPAQPAAGNDASTSLTGG